MELVLFIGIQASGKSSFYQLHFFRSHLRINLDMLRTRHREALLVKACFESKTKFLIDNTNLTRADRARYIVPARQHGYHLQGYFFETSVEAALERNRARPDPERVPDPALWHAAARLEPPSHSEGFDRLFLVNLNPAGGFSVANWPHQ